MQEHTRSCSSDTGQEGKVIRKKVLIRASVLIAAPLTSLSPPSSPLSPILSAKAHRHVHFYGDTEGVSRPAFRLALAIKGQSIPSRERPSYPDCQSHAADSQPSDAHLPKLVRPSHSFSLAIAEPIASSHRSCCSVEPALEQKTGRAVGSPAYFLFGF